MKVSRLMTKDVVACGPEASLSDAARVMWEHDCGFVPVVEPESGLLVGVLTDRDVCMAAYTKGAPLYGIPVHEVMTRSVESCRADEDLFEAQARMAEHQIRRLPVLDTGGSLVGVLSLNDIALNSLGEKTSRPRDEVARTLARIGRHREMATA
jgi:CBS domain-containing protein